MSDSLVSVLTALADDELVLGHRHSEWTGFAPHIEEDVAFSSIAQDEIGHAAAYYSIVAAVAGGDPDRLALGREPGGYRNAIVCERPNQEWAYTLARHWLYDHADAIRLESLAETAHEDLRALVNKIRREERYHLIHADTWMDRITHGPVEGRRKLIDSIAIVFDEAMGLFEPFELEDAAVEEGWLPVRSAELRERFISQVTNSLDKIGLPVHEARRPDEGAEFVASSSGDLIAGDGGNGAAPEHHEALGGRRGKRSPEFAALYEDLTSTYRAHPGAKW